MFSRWSRRKADVAREAEAPEAPVDVESELDGLSDEEILEKLELPDPASLKEGDDFSVFMASAVPDHIRRRALKTLWRSNPALANLDGLLEYGEDYTDAAMVPEVLNTAYKVGRGFLKDIIEEDEHPKAEEVAEISEPAEVEQTEADDDNDEAESSFEIAAADLVPEEEPYEPRRRMRFTTD